jgi:hypothetical protein
VSQQFHAGAGQVPVLRERNVEQAQRRIALPEGRRVPLVAGEPDDQQDNREERDRHQRQKPEPKWRNTPGRRSCGRNLVDHCHARWRKLGEPTGRWQMPDVG